MAIQGVFGQTGKGPLSKAPLTAEQLQGRLDTAVDPAGITSAPQIAEELGVPGGVPLPPGTQANIPGPEGISTTIEGETTAVGQPLSTIAPPLERGAEGALGGDLLAGTAIQQAQAEKEAGTLEEGSATLTPESQAAEVERQAGLVKSFSDDAYTWDTPQGYADTFRNENVKNEEGIHSVRGQIQNALFDDSIFELQEQQDGTHDPVQDTLAGFGLDVANNPAAQRAISTAGLYSIAEGLKFFNDTINYKELNKGHSVQDESLVGQKPQNGLFDYQLANRFGNNFAEMIGNPNIDPNAKETIGHMFLAIAEEKGLLTETKIDGKDVFLPTAQGKDLGYSAGSLVAERLSNGTPKTLMQRNAVGIGGTHIGATGSRKTGVTKGGFSLKPGQNQNVKTRVKDLQSKTLKTLKKTNAKMASAELADVNANIQEFTSTQAEELANKSFNKAEELANLSRFVGLKYSASDFAGKHKVSLDHQLATAKSQRTSATGSDVRGYSPVVEAANKIFNDKLGKFDKDNQYNRENLAFTESNPNNFLTNTYYHAMANGRMGASSLDGDFVGSKAFIREALGFKNNPISQASVNKTAAEVDRATSRSAKAVFAKKGKAAYEAFQQLDPQSRREINWRVAQAQSFLQVIDLMGRDAVTWVDPKGNTVRLSSPKGMTLEDLFSFYEQNSLQGGGNAITQTLKGLGEQWLAHTNVDGEIDLQAMKQGAPEVYKFLTNPSTRGETKNNTSVWENAVSYVADAEANKPHKFSFETQADATQSGLHLQAIVTGNMANLRRTGFTGRNSQGDLRQKFTDNVDAAVDTTFNGEHADKASAWKLVMDELLRGNSNNYNAEQYRSVFKDLFAKATLMQSAYGKDPAMFQDVAEEILQEVPVLYQILDTAYQGSEFDLVQDLQKIIEFNLRETLDPTFSNVMKGVGAMLSAFNADLVYTKNTPTGDPQAFGKRMMFTQFTRPDGDIQFDTTKIKTTSGKVREFEHKRGKATAIAPVEGKAFTKYDRETKQYYKVPYLTGPGKSTRSALPVLLIHQLDSAAVDLTTLWVNQNRQTPMPVEWIFDAAKVNADSLFDVVHSYNNIVLPGLLDWSIGDMVKTHYDAEKKKAVDKVDKDGHADISVRPHKNGNTEPLGPYSAITGFIDEYYSYKPTEVDPITGDSNIGFNKRYKDKKIFQAKLSKWNRHMADAKELGWIAPDPTVEGNTQARQNMVVTPTQYKQLLNLMGEMTGTEFYGSDNNLNNWVSGSNRQREGIKRDWLRNPTSSSQLTFG